MYQHVIAVVSDESYFSGLWTLLNSIYAYYGIDLRVFVFLNGPFALARRDALARHPLGGALTVLSTAEFGSPPGGCWEAKQHVYAFLIGKARNVCLLDADLVLLSRLDDVFRDSEAGRIVSCQDGHDQTFTEEHRPYSPRIVGARLPYFCTAFVCLDVERHWDLAGLWSFSARFGMHAHRPNPALSLPGHGDQGLFNGVAALLQKGAAFLAYDRQEWCHSQSAFEADDFVRIARRDGARLVVENRLTGGRQRLLHCSGPKWWTPKGRARFANRSDFLGCFDHFAQHPAPLDPRFASV